MDWLILILGVPAILIPLVLLFGFAGCGPNAAFCTDDSQCPPGTVCAFDGSCVPAGETTGTDTPSRPSPPENLHAISRDDHSVSLTWTNTDFAARDFQIERTPEDGNPELILAPDSPTGATDSFDRSQEGVTFIYRVQALLEGAPASDFSDTPISATVLPAAPVALRATAVSFDQIDLFWTNASTIATEFSLEHRVPGGVFAEIPGSRGTSTTFSHQNLIEGTTHEYRVFAIVVDGVEDDVPQEVKSAASLIASATTLAFTAVFTAPSGTLTNEVPSAGLCLVQRLSRSLLRAGSNPTQVRILLRGPITGSLTLDKVTISQAAAPGPGVDLYDSVPGPTVTDVASGVTLAVDAAMTVGPVNYALDASQDLLIAFDISNTPGQGNVRFGALTGADSFSNPNPNSGPPEAGVANRTPNYQNTALNTLALIELIEVL